MVQVLKYEGVWLGSGKGMEGGVGREWKGERIARSGGRADKGWVVEEDEGEG